MVSPEKLQIDEEKHIVYKGQLVQTYEPIDFSHKATIKSGNPTILLLMPPSGHACIGTCQNCKHNWFWVQNQNKLDQIKCPCYKHSTHDQILCQYVDPIFDLIICKTCHYLSQVTICHPLVETVESLRVCKCNYSKTKSSYDLYIFNYHAHKFLDNISLN